MIEKVIIFDASTLITFAMNGLLNELINLKKIFKGKFILPLEVKKEVVDGPMKIKRFELEALKIKKLIEEKIFELPDSLAITEEEISNGTKNLLEIANNLFEGKGEKIHLIDSGETACLSLSRILDKRKIKNIIAIDERTTRMLSEKPENLRQLFQKKLHINIKADKEKYGYFKGFKFIRSAELIYIAYKKGLINLDNGDVLDALLYAVKYKGCAISEREIEEIKKIK